MSVIEEVRQDRQDLARVLKKHKGIRRIVEDLYPDSAHFIYELLQNAEDTGATETTFVLSNTSLVFEHNGRPFDSKDIYAITDIGEGTKSGNEDKIGCFGIGFKSVFSYTETPRIWSPTYAFEISELVLPSELAEEQNLKGITRFEFPFNNPKKPATDAYMEILRGLAELSETSLLFLSHISLIRWQIKGKSEGEVSRKSHSEHHIEVLKRTNRKTTASSHFLRFTQPVDGLKKQHIAVAFELDVLPKIKAFDKKKPLSKQFRVTPTLPGRVAVSFIAEKETSGLRFHLHAPFVPELSRASIKDTPANKPLFQQLAKLSAIALFALRDYGLLTGEFLAVLPNSNDTIPERYQCIREVIVDSMNEHPLTPTYSKSHAPAKYLLQAKASLKSLLTSKDIEFLIPKKEEPLDWAVGASQKNSDIDRFLTNLEISEWDIYELLEVLEENLSYDRWDDETNDLVYEPSVKFLNWLSTKPDEWHQKLYALLYQELEEGDDIYRLGELCLIKLSTRKYSIASESYFPTDEIEQDKLFPRVAKAVYTSGKSKTEKVNARNLLMEIGVREVGEVEQIEMVLEQHYIKDAKHVDHKTHINHLKRFIAMVDENSNHAHIFNTYYVFMDNNNNWRKPSEIFFDVPFVNTGLSVFYKARRKNTKPQEWGDVTNNKAIWEKENKTALSDCYNSSDISSKKLFEFAKTIGVFSKLQIERQTTSRHPKRRALHQSGGRQTHTGIDRDWVIPHLKKILEDAPNESLSRLIWNTMMGASHSTLNATYRPNQQYMIRTERSTLVLTLEEVAWVPQRNEDYVCPCDASPELLPDGFPFDPGQAWVKAICFGENVIKQSEEHRKKREVAAELGFEDEESLNDAKWFASLNVEERERVKRDYKSRHTELPENEPGNPDRRATRVAEQAGDAPDRSTEVRSRSVSTTRDMIKKEADPYLRQQYTNNDGEMICQVCQTSLPFKLKDGSYYFEAVEFLPELINRHYQNYLALCPNHAAMFRHANDTKEMLKQLFEGIIDNQLEIILAREDAVIYFTKTHITDIKAVIVVDEDKILTEDST